MLTQFNLDRIWINEAENEVKKARDHLDDLERRSTWSPAVEVSVFRTYLGLRPVVKYTLSAGPQRAEQIQIQRQSPQPHDDG